MHVVLDELEILVTVSTRCGVIESIHLHCVRKDTWDEGTYMNDTHL